MIDICIVANGRNDTMPIVLFSIVAALRESLMDVATVRVYDNGELPIEGYIYEHMVAAISKSAVCYSKTRDIWNCGIANARNNLLRQCTSESVLFLDDDIVIDPSSISYFVNWNDKLERNMGYILGCVKETVAYRGKGTFTDDNIKNFFANEENISKNGLYYPYGVTGACVLYNTDKLISVGGFSHLAENWPDRQGGEDVVTQGLLLEKYGGYSCKEAVAY
jgi:hypothetical protein